MNLKNKNLLVNKCYVNGSWVGSEKKFKVINSWDNFVIPMPFSKGVYSFGKPIYIKKKINENELAMFKQKLELELKRLTKLVNQELS